MQYLKTKKIIVEEDSRESNKIRNEQGEVINYKQSKCTVRFIFEDKEGNEYTWVKENKDLAEAIRLISINEDKKYPYGLGRNMSFNVYYYPIWKKYLLENGFIPNLRDIDFSIAQTKKVDTEIEEYLKNFGEENEGG